MAFAVVNQNFTDNGNKEKVDFDALNAYVVETANLQERETLIGVVSVIADLGTQDQEDAEAPFTGSAADEEKIIAEKPDTYFKDGVDPKSKKVIRLKCWPQKPVQCVAIAVDFPDIIVDKGLFFGESKPLPLRLWMGGQFFIRDTGMVIQRLTALRVNEKLDDGWSLNQKNVLHKMAVAAKLIKPGKAFHPSRIDELLGQAFQFTAQVFMKPGKDKGTEYYTEYLQFVGALGRGQVAPETDVKPSLIQFSEDNDEEDVKGLRNHVVNTMRRASNFKGSKLEVQLAKVKGSKPAEPEAESSDEEEDETPAKPAPKPKATKPAKAVKPEKDVDPFADDESDPF